MNKCTCGHLDSEHAQYRYSCFVRDCACEEFQIGSVTSSLSEASPVIAQERSAEEHTLPKSSLPSVEEARDKLLRWLDKALWGRTDTQAAKLWEQAVADVDALISAVRAESGR